MLQSRPDPPRPHFLCIGAQKAATSWLHSAFQQCDDIWVPPIKELHYWDRLDRKQHEQGDGVTGQTLYKKNRSRYARNLRRVLKIIGSGNISAAKFYYEFLYRKRSDDWYRELFPSTARIAGEVTPGYAPLSGETISRIVTMNGDIRIIYLIRNPIDRAWSAYRYRKTREQTWEPSLDDFSLFLQTPFVQSHGNYMQNIETWTTHIQPGNMFVGFYDAVYEQPETLLRTLCEFLGARTLASLPKRRNVSLDAEFPANFRDIAFEQYQPELARLSRRFPGYPEDWARGSLISKGNHPVSYIL
ncbi:MAG: sulfotransferase [Pseudomonadota bacterium]